ncbi:MAG: PAS domain S-box protein [Deltaproteobacteria bacterium]|nr:PAS domain S-box protein [Deltaproteobacteria bacterium]
MTDEKKILQSILESSADGILVVDADRQISHCNDRFLALMNVPKEVAEQGDAGSLLTFLAGKIINPERFVDRVNRLYETLEDARDTLSMKDGRFVERISRPLIHNGRLIGRVWTFRDITAAVTTDKEKTAALQASENRYRIFVNAMRDMVYLKDSGFRHILANSALVDFFEKSAEADIIGLTDFDLMTPEMAAHCRHTDKEVLRQSRLIRTEEHSDGRIYETIKFPVPLGQGETGIGAIISNITEQKEVEERLRRSEEQYRELADRQADIIVTFDDKGIITYISPAVEGISGFRPEDLLGKHFRAVVTRGSLEQATEIFERTLNGESLTDLRLKMKHLNGALLDVELSSFPIIKANIPVGAQATVRDVTEKLAVQRKLLERQRYIEAIIDTAPDAIVTLDRQHRIVGWNKGSENLFGYRADEVKGKDLDEVVTNETNRGEARIHTEKVLKGMSVPRLEAVRCRKDGSPVNVILSGEPIMVNGEMVGIVGIYTDISNLKKAESSLRSSEERFRTIFESAQDSIFIKDRSLRYTYVNPAVERLFKRPADEIIGKGDDELFGPEAAGRIKEIDGKVLGGEILEEEDLLAAGEEQRIFHVVKVPLRDDRETIIGLCGIARDITKTKRLEQQLQRAQRLESIGTLAGGIAHDFNNLLMTIQGNASLMLLDMAPENPCYDRLKSVEEAVQDGAQLTRQLLGFAQGGKYEVKLTDVNELIFRTSEMFGRTKKEISIHRKFHEKLWTAEIDQGQISQVLLNLYVNAWQAMSGGGALYLETENVILDSEYAGIYKRTPGRYVKISVTDTGTGMDHQTMERIFDPFFTTKEIGRGTGLGLASAYGIIQNHQGIINVYSEKGHGATFTLYLPASEKSMIAQDTAAAALAKGTETILLVDDESMILDVGSELLRRLGYSVHQARNGNEALSIYTEHLNEIHLVILDMIMPGVGGGDIFDALRELNPDVKVLLASGYSLNGRAQEIIARGCKGFIQKPFSLSALAGKVREILQAER